MSELLTIELPESLAARLRLTAGTRSLPEVVVGLVERAMGDTPIEDLPDGDVLVAARGEMPFGEQSELTELLAAQREGQLSLERRLRLDRVMADYRRGLVAKAKAVKEAVARGLLPAVGDGA